MAEQSNAFDSYTAVGIEEDVENIIYNVSPEKTPALSMYRRIKGTQRVHQFQKDTISAGAQNAQLEGDTFVNSVATATTMQNNVMQIAYRVIGVTGTDLASKAYGRANELDYQMVKAGKKLKKDMDNDICANNAKVSGNGSTARQLAGLPAWITTNTDLASNGTNPTGDGSNARTDGTQRVFTEDLLLNALGLIYTNTESDIDTVLVGTFNKRQIAGFAGGAVRKIDANEKKVVASVDIYEDPWGNVLDVVPSRQVRQRDCLILASEYLKLAVLRPMQEIDLAKVADTDQRVLLTEYTQIPGTELAHGGVFDLTTA